MRAKDIFGLLKEAFQDWQEDKAPRLAAALSYYTIFSLAPLLIIAIAVAGAIFGEEAARGQIVGQIEGLVGRDGAQVIQTAIQNANQPGSNQGRIASLISIVVLLFGASGVFGELQDALNTLWEVQPKRERGFMGLMRKRFLSFSMVLGVGFLLTVSLLLSAILSGLSAYLSGLLPGADFLWQLLNLVVSFGVITFMFALIFKFLPDVKVTWNDVLIGAILTSLLFTVGKYALGLYLGRGSFGSTYGAAGSLVIILAWVYYSALILFFGAEFTQAYARKYGSQIVPDEHAEPMSDEARVKKQGPSRNR